jgi:hypothetical protein
MRKMFCGAVALGLATTVSLAWAAPGFAQEDPEDPGFTHLEATLTPKEVAPDGTVTVTSVDSCSTAGELELAVFHEGDFDWESGDNEADPVLVDFAETNEDGSWEITFSPADFGTIDPGEGDSLSKLAEEDPEEPGDEPVGFEVYGPLGFSVEGIDEQPDEAFEFVALCFDFGEEPVDLEDEITSHPFDEDFGVYDTKAGDDVTAASVDPCPVSEEGGESAQWFLFSEEDEVTEGPLELSSEGDWEVTFTAPDEAGFYFFAAECSGSDEELTGIYSDLVLANEVTGTPPVRPPAPASPIDEPPPNTG